MPRSTKPIPVAERNEHVANVALRVQAALWTAEPGQKDDLRRTWPRLADALGALDETLQLPVVQHRFEPPPGQMSRHHPNA